MIIYTYTSPVDAAFFSSFEQRRTLSYIANLCRTGYEGEAVRSLSEEQESSRS